jgi:transcriptional regulator with XRE-family HTH domain
VGITDDKSNGSQESLSRLKTATLAGEAGEGPQKSTEVHKIGEADSTKHQETWNRGGGRKPKYDSRATELRQRLLVWKQSPEGLRPSLRELARELGTSHQLLSHYLKGLDDWQCERDLEQFRANAKAKGLTVTPALVKRYLAWLARVREKEARDRARCEPKIRQLKQKIESLGGMDSLLKSIRSRWAG